MEAMGAIRWGDAPIFAPTGVRGGGERKERGGQEEGRVRKGRERELGRKEGNEGKERSGRRGREIACTEFSKSPRLLKPSIFVISRDVEYRRTD